MKCVIYNCSMFNYGHGLQPRSGLLGKTSVNSEWMNCCQFHLRVRYTFILFSEYSRYQTWRPPYERMMQEITNLWIWLVCSEFEIQSFHHSPQCKLVVENVYVKQENAERTEDIKENKPRWRWEDLWGTVGNKIWCPRNTGHARHAHYMALQSDNDR